jgi:hypothetical protein
MIFYLSIDNILNFQILYKLVGHLNCNKNISINCQSFMFLYLKNKLVDLYDLLFAFGLILHLDRNNYLDSTRNNCIVFLPARVTWISPNVDVGCGRYRLKKQWKTWQKISNRKQ